MDRNDVLLVAVLILGSIAILSGSILAAGGGFKFGNTVTADAHNGSTSGDINYEANSTTIGAIGSGPGQTGTYNNTAVFYNVTSSSSGSALEQSVVNATMTSGSADILAPTSMPTPTPAPQGTVDVYLSGFYDPNWPPYVEFSGPSNNLYHGRMRIPNQISVTGLYGLYTVSVSGSAGNMTYTGIGSVNLDSPHAEIRLNVTKV